MRGMWRAAAWGVMAWGMWAATAAAGEPLALVNPSVDAATRITASGQPDADVKAADGRVSFAMAVGEKSPFPGIAIKPAGGTWDLRAYGWVEVTLRNPGAEDVPVFVRVDDNSGLLPSGTWLTSPRVVVKAGQTAAVRVWMADQSHALRYILQRDRISQVLVFGGLPDKAVRLELVSAVAAGDPEARPDHYNAAIAPKDGVLADFAAGAALAYKAFGPVKHRVEAGQGLHIEFGGDKAVLLAGPPKAHWTLIPYNRLDFHFANPTDKPVTLAYGLDNWFEIAPDQIETRQATIPARGKLVAPFVFDDVPVWRSLIGSDGKAIVTDRESERVRGAGDVGGANLTSDYVGSLYFSAPAGAVVVEKVVAGRADPDVIPAWVGQRPPLDDPESLGDWKITFEDNFDAPELDESKWNRKMQWVGLPAGELSRYRPENVFVKDGMLRLVVRRERALYNNQEYHWMTPGQYSAGVASTWGKFVQRYGYIEAKMRLPRTYGIWPAFWAMPWHGPKTEGRRKGTRHGGAEIDIFEHLTRFGPYRTNIAVHWDDYGPDHKKTGTSRVYYRPDKDGFVVAGLLWEPGRLTWYVNGKAVGVWESAAVPTAPVYPKFTMPLGSWAGYGVNDEDLKDEDRSALDIDYIRVWQRDDWAKLPLPPLKEEPAAAPVGNRIVNPSMTELHADGRSPADWAQASAGKGRVLAVRDTEVFASAPASLRVTGEGVDAQGSVSQRIDNIRGRHTFSGRIKVGPGVKSAGVGAGCFDENWNLLKWIPVARLDGREADWTDFSATDDIPAGTNRVNLDVMIQGEGHVWVDDLSVAKAP